MLGRTLLAATLACVGSASTLAAQVPEPEALPFALVTTYADGRVTESAMSTRLRRSWTPYFPRVPRWQAPAGELPVTALDARAVRDGDVVRVTVSVLRGTYHEVEEPVATVAIGLHEVVVVEELRRVGVMPIRLSVKPFAAPALHVPESSSLVDGLIVEGIEPVIAPVPAYRITVRNLTETAAVTLAFTTFSQGTRHLEGQQGNPDAEPFVAPGETTTFTLRLTGGRGDGRGVATVVPLDEVRIVGAVWADGRTAGEPTRVDTMLAVHTGRLATLNAVIGVLRDAVAHSAHDPLGQARRVAAAVANVPSTPHALIVADAVRGTKRDAEAFTGAMAAGTLDVRRRLSEDLDRVTTSMTPDDARHWLVEALTAVEAWRGRLQAIVRPQ